MSKEEIYERPWVKKFENGEYLRNWKGYDTILIGGPYSDNIGIGEEKFIHCMDFFCGIGDVDWWIKSELDKLTEDEKKELEWICRYKTYLGKEIITIEKVRLLSEFYGCETFHIYRTGDKEILNLIKILNNFHSLIENGSKNCRDTKTDKWKETPNNFEVMSFEEYKEHHTPKPVGFEVIGFDVLKDGGSIIIKTNIDYYFIDRRLKSMTIDVIYKGIPESLEDYGKIIKGESLTNTITNLIVGLSTYKNDFYQTAINQTVTDLKNRLN
jgi:hypothetical protein